MKKKGAIVAGLLMAVVVTGYSVSGTYAKYLTPVAEDSTSTAKILALPTVENDYTLKLWEDGDKIQPGSYGTKSLELESLDDFNISLAVKTVTNNVELVEGTDSADYNPLRFRVSLETETVDPDDSEKTVKTRTYYDKDGEKIVEGGNRWLTANELKTAMSNIKYTAGTVYIDWQWFYDNNTPTIADLTAENGDPSLALNTAEETAAKALSNDKLDTELGQKAKDAGAGNEPSVQITFSATAEQKIN